MKGLLAVAVAVLVLALWLVSLDAVWGSTGTTTENEVFGYLTAVLVLVAFTNLVYVLGQSAKGLVLGKDNRVSTSKLQVVVWTYVIGGAIIALIAQTWVGADAGFDALTSSSFDFEPYLVLLGGPFLAAVGARAIVGAQVKKGEKAKPPGDPKAAQVVTDDSGNADLVDCQYLLFNLIAVIYFVGAFVENPAAGLPAIPALIYVLTGAAALGYVSNKAIPSGPPEITGISPAAGLRGTEVKVFGTGLLFPRDPVATTVPNSVAQFHDVEVLIGGHTAPIVDGALSSTGAGGDRLRVTVPTALAAGEEHDVVALNFRGVQTSPVKFRVTG
jgi:hypothetical protein